MRARKGGARSPAGGQSAKGDLVAAVHRSEDFPRSRRPVLAFVGRSNVGKSTLLNRLLGRKAARTSRTPGKTRGIYFYETDEGHQIADLPGTGFARVSKRERETWADLADELFAGGRVRLAVTLVDPYVPRAEADFRMRQYLRDRGVPTLAVATKWDRLSARERDRARRELLEAHGEVFPVSAKTGEGIENLRREIRVRMDRKEDGSNG
ncbi:MAG: ribosome biogenesis GTP-binding protein YihA/YsxC [Thermoanaerobaculia bacterium]